MLFRRLGQLRRFIAGLSLSACLTAGAQAQDVNSQAPHNTHLLNAKTDLHFVADGTTNNQALLPVLMGLKNSPTVHFPAGTYNIGCPSQITTAASAISLEGDAEGQTVLRLASGCTLSADLFHWNGVSGFHIQQLTVDCNSANIKNHTIFGLYAYNGNMGDATIRQVKIDNCTPPDASTPSGSLITLAAAAGYTMSTVSILNNNLTFNGPMTTGVNNFLNFAENYPRNPGIINKAIVIGNRFANCGNQMSGNNFKILYNDFNGRGMYFPGLQASSPYTGNSNHVIIGNDFHNFTTIRDVDGGAAVGMEFGALHSVIMGNNCYKTGGNCIAHYGAYNLIEGNISVDGGQVTAPHAGNENCAFTNNLASGKMYGHDSQWIGNVAYDDQTSPTQLNGYCEYVISSGGKPTNISFQGNHFTGYLGGQAFLLQHPWPSDWMPLGSVSVSNAAALQLTGIDPSFGAYQLSCTGLYPNTNGGALQLQVGEGAHSTWQHGIYTNAGYNIPESTGTLATFDSHTTAFMITGGLGAASPDAATVLLATFDALGATAVHHKINWQLSFVDSVSQSTNSLHGGGSYNGDTNAVTGLQLLASSGHITGKCTLYGRL